MIKTTVRIYTHHFAVCHPTKAVLDSLRPFAAQLIQWNWLEKNNSWTKEIGAYYFSWNQDKTILRFHINLLEAFKSRLVADGMSLGDMLFINMPVPKGAFVRFYVKEHMKPRDVQIKIVPQVLKDKPISKFLGAQPGLGKSFLSMKGMEHWSERTVVITKPGYLDNWVKALKKTLDIRNSEIMIVTGSEMLSRVIRDLHDGTLKLSVVLLSNATYRSWLSQQEEMPGEEPVPGFPCTAWDFFEYAKIGYRVIDEVHQDYHLNFKADLYSNVPQSISLSGSLFTKDKFEQSMYDLAYPESCHIDIPKPEKYICASPWFYDFIDTQGIRTSAWGRTSYSHIEFEKSLMRSARKLKHYLHMVCESIRKTYMVNRRVGDKCIIYFSTKKMCFLAKQAIKKQFPALNVTKFNQGDPFSNLLEMDICCATLQKAGTAVDIPMLTTVILTIAIDSVKANLQALGRLRDLLELYQYDRIPMFLYYVCNNFKKHKHYHKEKQDILKDRAKYITAMNHNVSLGH